MEPNLVILPAIVRATILLHDFPREVFRRGEFLDGELHLTAMVPFAIILEPETISNARNFSATVGEGPRLPCAGASGASS